ncbi:MAG: hypothetical protein WKG07_24300 [Hymenobacter sp.]
MREAAVSTTLRRGGQPSMIYTSIVLFVGFSVFAFSEFGGTKALGLLMSARLLITNFSNLILLPCLLVTFEHGKDETINPKPYFNTTTTITTRKTTTANLTSAVMTREAARYGSVNNHVTLAGEKGTNFSVY